MADVTSYKVTGDWRHVVGDTYADTDAEPDIAIPEGRVTFTPVSPKQAITGAPAIAYSLEPVRANIRDGQLVDSQDRIGVMLAGYIGGQVVQWRATTYLEYLGEEIKYPTLDFQLTTDIRLTGLIKNDEPGQPPYVVDARVEALVQQAQTALDQANAGLAVMTEQHEDIEQWHADIMPAATQVAENTQATKDASALAALAAAESESRAEESASSAALSEASASAAASSEGNARQYSEAAAESQGAAESERVTVEQIRDALQTLLADSEAWIGFEEALSQIEPRVAAEIDKLKGDAPEAFDTLGEVAAWIADHSDEASAMLQSISERAKTTYVDEQLSGKADKGAENTAQWSQVSGKPSTFPPESHTHTKDQVGLSNVDNTSDANKPISTAAQSALNGKAATSHTHTTAQIPGLDSILAGKAATSHTHATSQIPGLDTSLAAKADLVSGKVPTSQIPAIALTKPSSVADRAAMLALTAEEGDIAVITSGADKGTYMLGEGASTAFASWIPLSSADSSVLSVNGQTGTVNLGAADVGAATTSHTHTTAQVPGLDTALLGKADTGHKHVATDMNATGTPSATTFYRGDDQWVTPPNTTYSVPTQAEAEAGTATTARAFSAQRARQSANAAIAAKFQVVSALPGSPDPNVIYLVLE